ncbi:MAG: hypothetical protein M3R64_11360 [Pseudomonadota bacterium]|nr:hypothetical protein [Pseudomonadota bacterium]
MPTKTIVCLAASKKHGGFCYAGKDADGVWIRPVSDDEGHAISPYWRVVGKGDPAVVGDRLRMTLGAAKPTDWQTENYEHVEEHWRRVGKASYADIVALADDPDALWPAGRSSAHGANDDMTEAEAAGFDHSLLLIEVADLVVSCTDDGFHDEVKLKTRAFFTYKGERYGFVTTDPRYHRDTVGDEEIGEAMLCCSLAEAYSWQDGSRHVSKLVAAIITPETLD